MILRVLELRKNVFQANDFKEALYNTDWVHMSPANKRTVLLLMLGSERKVNICAGTYELNLALFAQVTENGSQKSAIPLNCISFQTMKGGLTLCAFMQAV